MPNVVPVISARVTGVVTVEAVEISVVVSGIPVEWVKTYPPSYKFQNLFIIRTTFFLQKINFS